MIDLSVYLVTDSGIAQRAGHNVQDVIDTAVKGGVTTVQIREKDADARDFLELVEQAARVTPEHVSLIVNDRIDVFLAARARGIEVSGVHIGQQDLPPEAVRLMVGPDAIIGLSASTREQLIAAENSPADIDYVGIGTLRHTSSKADAPEPLGLELLGELARGTSLPAVAIGGVTRDDLSALKREGLDGAAVVSWICGASDPRAAAEELAQAWNGQ